VRSKYFERGMEGDYTSYVRNFGGRDSERMQVLYKSNWKLWK
jgi:hypothetical protein